MSVEVSADVIARNPATGLELGRQPATPPESVSAIVSRARAAQKQWGDLPWRARREALARWWNLLSSRADAWADAIRAEIGKPRSEALAEVIMALDSIRWTVKHGGRALADERIRVGWQRLLLMPGGIVRHRPVGVVGIVGTWNYPFFLNAPAIAQALAAGNAVVWKPSEYASWTGRMLTESVAAAGLPEGLVAAVYGGPRVGGALTASDLNKAHFTGGVENGRRVLAALAERGIPAVAELAGFDAAIVLDDAPRDATVRALTWSAFVGAGQTCVAVKRIYVVGDPVPWIEAIADSARQLRLGDPANGPIDVGPLISESARERCDNFIRAAVDAGARVHCGAKPLSGAGAFYPPTVLSADTAESERALAGVFGPVVLIRGVRSPQDAIAAANACQYGLAASVWGRERKRAWEIASAIEAGMVTVNEAVTPAGIASAPFGGTKASGFGRIHGPLGLREFTYPQAISARAARAFRPQVFPYSPRIERLLTLYRRWIHPGRVRRN